MMMITIITQYAVAVVLNNEKIKKCKQRVSKIKPLINKYSWYRIKYGSKIED